MRATGLFVLLTLLAPAASGADPTFPIAVTAGRAEESDRYCGLYCVHEAGRLTGHPVDLERLVRPERVSGRHGSTVQDVLDACAEFGIRAAYTPAASYADLYLLGGPALVLVKNQPGATDPNHWMLVVRADAAAADVYDPGVGVIRVSAAELQSLWAGPTVAVYADADGTAGPVVWAAGRVLLVALGVGAAAAMLRVMGRSRVPSTVALAGATALIVVVLHAVSLAGFARNPAAVGELMSAGRPRAVGHVTPQEAGRLRGDPGVVFVDARTLPQYLRERVPGAVAIPYLAPHFQKKRAVADLPATAHVVLYCESPDCPWAEALGSGTLFRHFPRVSVLDGGIQEYAAAGGPCAAGKP